MHHSDPNEKEILARLAEQNKLIADLKQKEHNLAQENRYLRELYDRSPLGYQSLDENGCLIETNKAWLEILGYSRAEVIGHNFGDFLGEKWRTHYKENFPTLKAVGEILGFEFEMVKKDGSTLMVNLDGRVGTNHRGEFQQTYCIIKDITRQKHDEEILQSLQQELHQAQKMESIGRLAGGIAHDFNNMLTAIIGHVELAKLHCKPELPVHSRLDSIENAAHRSAALVNQLLAFARKQTIVPQVINLNECVTQVWDMLAKVLGEDISLVNIPANNIWKIKIDPSQVDQILTNLCVNARDAIVDTGTITLETKNIILEPDYIAHNPSVTPGKYVQLSVSDDGEGMETSTLNHIFEPFYTTKPAGVGTGLGLSSVYGVVQQNGGLITVSSEYGVGTTFNIFLPCQEETTSKHIVENLDLPTGNGERILFVEDEEAILAIGEEMLSILGYQVVTASSPKQALSAVQDQHMKFDLLITDVIMPEMNGQELADSLKHITPEMPCLFISGYTKNIIANRGMLDETINYLQKPFSSKDIAKAVHQALTGTS